MSESPFVLVTSCVVISTSLHLPVLLWSLFLNLSRFFFQAYPTLETVLMKSRATADISQK